MTPAAGPLADVVRDLKPPLQCNGYVDGTFGKNRGYVVVDCNGHTVAHFVKERHAHTFLDLVRECWES